MIAAIITAKTIITRHEKFFNWIFPSKGSRFKVQGSGFKVQGSRFKVQGFLVPMLQRGNAYRMGVTTLEHGNQATQNSKSCLNEVFVQAFQAL